MSSKKRNSGKRKTHRQGVSGNPQRRAQQLRQERPAAQGQPTPREPQTHPDRAAFRELAYRLAGGAQAESWWRESHERILARARALTWPSRLVDLETQACQMVGDEFYDRLQARETGLHPVQWLRALAEETGAALRAEIARGADDWQKLWALLCGLALTAPRAPADAVSETVLRGREIFPDIKDPYETALAEADKVAGLLTIALELTDSAGRPMQADTHLGQRVGGQADIRTVTAASLIDEAVTWGIRRRAASAVTETLDQVLATVTAVPGDARVLAVIREQAERLTASARAG